MKKKQLILAALAIAAIATGCKQSSDMNNDNTMSDTNSPSTMQSVKEGVTNAWEHTKDATTNAAISAWTDIKDSVGSMSDYTYDKKDEYVTKAQADVTALDQKIQNLSDKAATTTDSVKADAQAKIQDLNSQRDTLNQKLDNVKNATQDNWDSAKTDFKNAYDSAKSSVKQAWQWMKDKTNS